MKKIYLEGSTLDKYDIYYKIRSTPSDIYWNGYTSKPDELEFKDIYRKCVYDADFSCSGDRKIFFVKLKCENQPDDYVGFVQLIRRDDSVEIGYGILEEYQKRGYATEALRQARSIAHRYSKKLIIRIRDDHVASIKVAEKNNFFPTEEYQIKDCPNVGAVKLRTYRLKEQGE